LIRSAIAVLALSCAASAAWADDCGPLKLIASLETTPISSDNSGFTVQAKLNDTLTPMLVSTGSLISTLDQSAVNTLGLHAVANSSVILVQDRKQSSESFVEVADFRLGAIHVPRMQFEVPPDSNAARKWSGILGSDLLSVYDLEINPSGHQLNFFAKDHCPGHVLYWKPTALAVLPFRTQLPTANNTRTGFNLYFQRGAKIYVPVKLDGHDVEASISTLSQYSSMSASMAKFVFGVTPESPGSTPESSSDPQHAGFIHVFPSMTFDTVTVTNARVRIYPDPDVSNADVFKRTDTRLRQSTGYFTESMSIGMDVLRRLRMFVAFSENKLYITPATAPVAPVTASAPAAPAAAAQ
jgi:hypothetical protein